jgi:hypothetical protein
LGLAHGAASETRLVLATVGPDFVLTAKTLSIDAKKPSPMVGQDTSISNWSAVVNDARTFFKAEPEFVIPVLPEPNLY